MLHFLLVALPSSFPSSSSSSFFFFGRGLHGEVGEGRPGLHQDAVQAAELRIGGREGEREGGREGGREGEW